MQSKTPAGGRRSSARPRQAWFCKAKCPLAAGGQAPAQGRRGFAKQNARWQRAVKRPPKAGAVLQSKTPAGGRRSSARPRQARFCRVKRPLATGGQAPAQGRRSFTRQSTPAAAHKAAPAQSGLARSFRAKGRSRKAPMAGPKAAMGACFHAVPELQGKARPGTAPARRAGFAGSACPVPVSPAPPC